MWALRITKQKGRVHLVVYIDNPEGITLADCEKVSRLIETVLEENSPIKGSFDLEVSSPGLERILVKPEHFRRYRGKKVKIKIKSPRLSRKKISGIITRADDNTVTVEDNEGRAFTLFFEEITAAHVWFIPGSKEEKP